MMHLLAAGRKLSFSPSIYYGRLGTKPQGSTGGVHCHITSSDNNNSLTCMYRSHIVLTISLHQVVPGKEFVCGEHSIEVLPGDTHELRKTCARADEHGLKAFDIHKRIYGNCPSHNDIGLNLHTQATYIFYLRSDHLVLWKPELRDTILQHSSRAVKGLEDGHVITLLRKVARTGKTCRATAHNCHLMAVCRSLLHLSTTLFATPVCDKALQFADCNRLTLDA